MSVVFGVAEGALLLLAAAAAIVSVLGIAASRDVYAQLIFGSIASGGALVALVSAVIIEEGASIATAQCIVLLLLMVPSSAIATHRIAALVRDRDRSSPLPGADQ
ncbi:MAG: hypothetical protein EON55_05550 [Alphaproteobacteria bacterium]|nr:MAG: hypothetical protein EON55_05550 [Alphaproteobacteria bacterium]